MHVLCLGYLVSCKTCKRSGLEVPNESDAHMGDTDVRIKERKECDRKKRDQRLSFGVFYNRQETGISREGG